MAYDKYNEVKPHYLKMVMWRILNASVFRILPRNVRHALLRLCGARIGRRCAIYPTVKIYAPWNLYVSDGVVIGPRVEIYNKCSVRIGEQAVISQDSFICTASHNVNSKSMALTLKPIKIEAQAWVASRAIILPGVTIAEGGVVAAGSVVSKNVAEWTVVGGNPAKEIKKRVFA